MDLADRFGLPVITLVDTPGAYPGKGAEERGQSEAIARSTEKCLQIGVPLISVIIGEGGSGGAVAFATATARDAGALDLLGDLARGLRLDPLEGCREDARGGRGAAPHRAGPDKLGVCDLVIKEPLGGAQRNPSDATIAEGRQGDLAEMDGQSRKKLVADRRKKFLDIGQKGLAA
jgi:acetyl-CoA carboxylase carboxyl transferase subunit alpha